LRLRLIAPLALILALAVSSIAYASTRSSSVVAPTKVTVTLADYSFTFSKPAVKKLKAPLTVIFTVKNTGSVQHDMDITGVNKRTALISPGGHATLKVIFKKKGSFQVVCDVPRHIQLGMVSSFTVK
jgi:uncharacterized cupredoxin-like copper-binding protein